MGAVYRGFDTVLDHPVAIKQLLPTGVTDPATAVAFRRQFEHEAKILAALSHPNLPRVTDYFTVDNIPYLIMDYIEGETLSDLLKQEPQGFPESQVVNWADQILSALVYIHAHGVIHRDIKPGNLRLRSDGHIFLVDFGLSKSLLSDHPETATIMRGIGTAEYAPPEQYDSTYGHTDARADIYSLGATLYHLLVGHAPATVTQRMADPEKFEPLDTQAVNVSPQVAQVIARAIELPRNRRFTSAADMQAAVRLARASVPLKADAGVKTTLLTAGNLAQPQTQKRRGRRLIVGLAMIGTLAVICAAGTVIISGQQLVSPVSTPTLSPTDLLTQTTNLSPTDLLTQTTTLSPTDMLTQTATLTITPTILIVIPTATLSPSPTATLKPERPQATPVPPQPTSKPKPTQKPRPTKATTK